MSSSSRPPSGSIASPSVSVATPYFAEAFEYLGAKIQAEHLAWSPHSNPDDAALDPTLSRRVLVARANERSNANEKAARWVKNNFTRLLKSGFSAVLGKGKRAAAVPDPSSDNSRRSKRQRLSTIHLSAPPSTVAASVGAFDSTFSEDSLAPFHLPIPISTESAPYTRIGAHKMIRLDIDDEFILLFPAVTPTLNPKCLPAAVDINRRIDRVLIQSCTGITSSERREQLIFLKRKHIKMRGSETYYEFAVRIKHFGEMKDMELNSLRQSDLDRLWKSDGFGPSIEICGYARTTTALLRLRYYPYIEMYKRSSSLFLDEVEFPRGGDLDESFLQAIWLAKGCTSRTVEVMMRYYQELSQRRQRQCLYLKNQLKKKSEGEELLNDSHDRYARRDFMRTIHEELKANRLFAFADKVDGIYETRFKLVYSNFVPMRNSVVSSADIISLYETFISDFPHTHAILSVIVSSPNDKVPLATSLINDADDDGSDGSCCEESANVNDGHPELTRTQRSIFEYFLCFIRHKSQKRLRHWAMLTPLGYFSRGFRMPGSKCHLSAASCDLRTAWITSNKLYENSRPGRKEMIRQLATSSACGDNWQVKIGKDFQDGKSGIM